jgi:hypothetical protein
MPGYLLRVGIALFCLGGSAASFAADDFTLASPSFEDNGKLAVKNAGNDKSNPNCVGENVSPPLEWRNPPTGTKSFALILVDPEGPRRPWGGALGRLRHPCIGDEIYRGRSEQAFGQIHRREGYAQSRYLFRPMHAAWELASLYLYTHRH